MAGDERQQPVDPQRRPWEERLHDAGLRVEEELRRVMVYLDDVVVPEVRRNGSEALRAAAVELQRLAERMDDRPAPPPRGDAERGPGDGRQP